MSVVTGGENRVLLSDISWATFQALATESNRGGTRFTYDQGRLEIMPPSTEHQWLKTLIGRMVEMMAFQLEIAIRSGGSTTLLNELAERGVEPDECYYVANEARVRGRDDIDLAVDPPPDLAIEIDVTSSSINQLPIYASLGVPEVWLYHGGLLRAFVLGSDGNYQQQPQSAAFPFLSLDGFQQFLEQRNLKDENSLIREFVASLPKKGGNTSGAIAGEEQ